jgi:hypothetical protein
MRPNLLPIALLLTFCCHKQQPAQSSHKLETPTTLTVQNNTDSATVVNFAFGADSVVLPTAWPACTATAPLNCNMTVAAHSGAALPVGGYLNATLAFGGAVGCGSTKAELNMNNPKWYNVLDISLVDGYSNKVSITSDGKTLGPPLGAQGNEKVFGLYPLGCDICTARQNPPCGMSPGGHGCKGGTQYKPDVPCQYQGPKMGGGSNVVVSLEG